MYELENKTALAIGVCKHLLRSVCEYNLVCYIFHALFPRKQPCFLIVFHIPLCYVDSLPIPCPCPTVDLFFPAVDVLRCPAALTAGSTSRNLWLLCPGTHVPRGQACREPAVWWWDPFETA